MINKRVIAITILLFLCSFSICQTYSVKSLDGQDCKINVITDEKNNLTKLIYSSDTICLNDFYLAAKAQVLNNCFLKVNYSERGGTGVTFQRQLYACISGNRLIIALDILDKDAEELTRVFDNAADSLKLFGEHILYQVKLNLVGSNVDNYRIKANIHNHRQSKQSPSDNCDYYKTDSLNFDNKLNIFYNGFKSPDGKIKYPAITLDKNEYYYIDNSWYEKNENGFTPCYAKCPNK